MANALDPRLEALISGKQAQVSAASQPAIAAPAPAPTAPAPTASPTDQKIMSQQAHTEMQFNQRAAQGQRGMEQAAQNPMQTALGMAGNLLTGGQPMAADQAAGGVTQINQPNYDLARAASVVGADVTVAPRIANALNTLQALGVPMSPSAKLVAAAAMGASVMTLAEMPAIFGETRAKGDVDMSTPEGWKTFAESVYDAGKWNGIGAGLSMIPGGRQVARDWWMRKTVDHEAIARAKAVADNYATLDRTNMRDLSGRPLTGKTRQAANDALDFAAEMPLSRAAAVESQVTTMTENLLKGSVFGGPLRRNEAMREAAQGAWLSNWYRTIAPTMHPGAMVESLKAMLPETKAGIKGAITGLRRATAKTARDEGIHIVDLRAGRKVARSTLSKARATAGDTTAVPKLTRNLARGRIGGGSRDPDVIAHVDQNVMPQIDATLRRKYQLTDEHVAGAYRSSPGADQGIKARLANYNRDLAAARADELSNFITVDRMQRVIARANTDSAGAHKAVRTGAANIDTAAFQTQAAQFKEILGNHFERYPGSQSAIAWDAFRNLNEAWKIAAHEQKTQISKLMLKAMSDMDSPAASAADVLYRSTLDETRTLMSAIRDAPIEFVRKVGRMSPERAANLDTALGMIPAKAASRVRTANDALKAAQQRALKQVQLDHLDIMVRKSVKNTAENLNVLTPNDFVTTLSHEGIDKMSEIHGREPTATMFNFMDHLIDLGAKSADEGAHLSGGLVNFRETNAVLNAGRAAITMPGAALSAAPLAALSGNAVAVVAGLGTIPLGIKMSRMLASPARMKKFIEVIEAVNDPRYNPFAPAGSRFSARNTMRAINGGTNAFGIQRMIAEMQNMDDDGKVDPRVTAVLNAKERSQSPFMPAP